MKETRFWMIRHAVVDEASRAILYGVTGSTAWFTGYSYAPVWTRIASFTASGVTAPSTFKRSVVPYSSAYIDTSGTPLFVMAFAFGFKGVIVTVVTASLIIGSVLLAPSIVLGYAVKAAEREDRENGL